MLIKKNQRGVTLFELMVTIILSGIMMTGAVIIYSEFMKMWDQDNIYLEVQRQGTYSLGVMEQAIKSGEKYDLSNYENDKYHKITVTILVVNKDTGVTSAKDKEYYLDKTTSPITIKEKDSQTSVETPLCPDTYSEDGEVKSDFEVEDLTFADENRLDAAGNIVARAVRIDLKLKKPKVLDTDVEEIFDFTISDRLRNENVN
jgi:prepilin-type N-terminal cleavage/methylation domain-containing protein